MHIARLAPDVAWDAIVTADHDPQRAKPRPDLYLEALELIGVDAADAVAFEDSPNGIRAAKAAGIFCVAVPNDVTRVARAGRGRPRARVARASYRRPSSIRRLDG